MNHFRAQVKADQAQRPKNKLQQQGQIPRTLAQEQQEERARTEKERNVIHLRCKGERQRREFEELMDEHLQLQSERDYLAAENEQLCEMSGSAADETSNNMPVLTTMWQAYTGSSSSSPVAQICKALDKAVQEKNKLSSMLQATGPALDKMRGQLLEVECQVQAVTQERDELEAALHKERVQHNKWKSKTMTMTRDRSKFCDKLRQAKHECQEAAAVHKTQMHQAQQLIAKKMLQTKQLKQQEC